ncbi:MAG: glycosyltransferase family 2 protein [Roseburia sp.]|nr:glycosyltransferase family 2 protein [Roseburia sp.]
MVRRLYEAVRKQKREQKKGWRFWYKVNKFIANVFAPLSQYFNHKKGIDEKHEIIVSLTTFPARIKMVWITIATIMNQTYKPKRIILWLDREQFPNGAGIPNKLNALQKRGLEIRFCEDLKPHKKYFYTMKENPEEIVVTIDDDVLYPENHLEQLWKLHLKYPDAVCCQYAHRIRYDEKGQFAAYEKWDSSNGEGGAPTLQIMPVGCGGVLYPPHLLDEELFNKEAIQRLCLMMDDLWLKSMAALHGTKAVMYNDVSLIYFDVLGTRKSGLQHSNAGEKKNDVAIKAIVNEYPEVLRILYEDWKKQKAQCFYHKV